MSDGSRRRRPPGAVWMVGLLVVAGLGGAPASAAGTVGRGTGVPGMVVSGPRPAEGLVGVGGPARVTGLPGSGRVAGLAGPAAGPGGTARGGGAAGAGG